MKKSIFLIFVFAFVSAATAGSAFACSCIPQPENISLEKQVKQAFDDSTAVFSGEVLQITSEPQSFTVKIKFKVEKSWKNQSFKEVTITTGLNDGFCGYGFEVGEKYLVYAYGKQNDLGTGLCTRTALLKSNKDATALNKAAKRKSKSSPK